MNQHSPRLRMHPYAGFLHPAWPPPDIPVMASVILVPVVPVALVAEAVRPVPGPISPAQVGDDDTRGEVLELPRAARERCVARARHPTEVYMTERDVVARAWWNERYVSDDRCSGGGVRIDNFGAAGDLLQGRYRERAEPAREPRVLRAVLHSVEASGTRGGLRERQGPFRLGHLRRGQTRYDPLWSRRVRAGCDDDRGNDGGGDEKFAVDHSEQPETSTAWNIPAFP